MTSPLLTPEAISDIHLKARIEWQNLPQPKPSLYDYQDQYVAHAQLVAVVKWLEEPCNIHSQSDFATPDRAWCPSHRYLCPDCMAEIKKEIA